MLAVLIGEIGSDEKFLCFPKSRNGIVKNKETLRKPVYDAI